MSIKQIDGYKIYLNKKLGQGSYGAVYVGVSDDTHQNVAVKILKKSSIDSDDYLKSALFSEIKIMQSVKSQNIVGFYDVMESTSNYYIVQQLCDGDLGQLMKGGKKIPESEAKQFLLQIINGFLALVREGIIHRDMKPANVMRKNNNLKIGDFGFSKKTQHTSMVKNQTIVGTPLYMSLEILKSQSYSSKCDIWAIGFIYYEMLHGRTPWIGKSQYDLIKKIQTKPLEIDNQFSAETKDFLKRCLAINEKDRICWDQVFAHPIFHGYFLSKSDGNNNFENKLKTVMSDLRFQINSNNLDICKILASLGYTSQGQQLNKLQFYQFLKVVSPSISRQQAEYIFQKTDNDKNGSISITEIQNIMSQHSISLTSIYQHIPKYKKQDTLHAQEGMQMSKMSLQTEQKVKKCFIKLMHYLQKSHRILYDVFNQFDKSKTNSLNREQFRYMLQQLSKDITDDQIDAAFDLIDEDNSKTVQFQELNNYFSKVNGIPKHLNRPSAHLDSSTGINGADIFQRMFNNYGSGYSNNVPPMQPPQMGYGNPYYQQQYPGMYGPPSHNGYPQHQPPPQPQQGNYFNNFLMHHLGNPQNGSNNGHSKKW